MKSPAVATADRALGSILRLVAIGFLLFVGTGIVLLVFLLTVGPPGQESRELGEDQVMEREAVLLIDVVFDPRPRVDQELQLRLGPRDVADMGVHLDVFASNHWGDFELRTSHLVRPRSAPYEHCLVEEAVVYNITRAVTEHVFPAGTCLRSDEPLELEL